MSKLITENDLKAILDEVLPNLMVDFVVDEGTDNNWKYRKWNNGTFEAWQFYQATGLAMGTSSSGTYYNSSTGRKTISLPSFYKTVDYILAKEKASMGSGIWIYTVGWISGGLLQIDYRSHASVSDAVCGGDFYIKGTWK